MLGKIFSAPQLTRSATGGTVTSLQLQDVFVGGPPTYPLTGAFTIPPGTTLHVQNRLDMRGVQLDVSGRLALTGTVRMSNVGGGASKIVVNAGGLMDGVESSASVECDTGSEIFADGGTVDKTNISIPMQCQSSCFLAKNGGVFRFGTGTQAFSGGAFLANLGGTVEVPDQAQLVFEPSAGNIRIEAGALFRLGAESGLTFRKAVTMAGTAASPVRFERLAPGAAWGEVRLGGDGSSLSHVVLDGGTSNLAVYADNVTVDHVTSRNGDQTLRTNYEDDDGSFADGLVITNSLFEDATKYGLNLYFTSATVRNSTVRRAGWNAVNVFIASVHAFSGNTVVGGDASGVAVSDQGFVNFSYGIPGPGAHNRVADHASHEVWLGSGASAVIGGAAPPGSPGWPGPSASACNAITRGTGAAGSKLVYNGTGQSVDARYNYWGGPPTSSDFHGPVDRSSALSSDPTSGGACGSGGPVSSATGDAPAAVSDGAAGPTSPGPAGAHASAGVPPDRRPMPAEVAAELAARLDAAHAAVEARPDSAADAVAHLYALALADFDDVTGRRARTLATLDALAGRVRALPASAGPAREGAELAAFALARHAFAHGDVAEARARFDAFAPDLATPRLQRSALAFESALMTLEGRVDEARARLEAYGAAEAAQAAVAPGYEPADLTPALAALASAGTSADASSGAAATSAPPLRSASAEAARAAEPGLSPPHPNPTRSGATVELVTESGGRARVEVFDALGRRVAVVHDGPVEPGSVTLDVATGGLPAGVYVLRATVEGRGATSVYARALTVVR